jgi:hypothetical protein
MLTGKTEAVGETFAPAPRCPPHATKADVKC